MSTSNTFNYSVTAAEIINAAFSKAGLLLSGTSTSTVQMTEGLGILNRMLKAWAPEGRNFWTRERGFILPQRSKDPWHQIINLGETGDHWTNNYWTTTTSANSGIASLILTLTSTSDIQDNDYIGVEQTNSIIQWSKVNGLPVGNTVTIDDNLQEAVISGANVYIYRTKAVRPLKIEGTWLVSRDNTTRWTIQNKSLQQFLALSGPANNMSLPVQTSYWRRTGGEQPVGTGKFYVWPGFNSTDYVIEVLFQQPLMNIDSSSQELNIPQEYYEVFEYGLAVRLAANYGMAIQDRMILKQEFEGILNRAQLQDEEPGSVYFIPDMRSYGD